MVCSAIAHVRTSYSWQKSSQCSSLQELFRRLPHQRILSENEQKEAESMLVLKANKKLIQDKLASATGKAVLLKDLTNISTRMRKGDTRNDLQKCVQNLQEVYGKFAYK